MGRGPASRGGRRGKSGSAAWSLDERAFVIVSQEYEQRVGEWCTRLYGPFESESAATDWANDARMDGAYYVTEIVRPS